MILGVAGTRPRKQVRRPLEPSLPTGDNSGATMTDGKKRRQTGESASGALDLLEADHHAVEKLFAAFERADSADLDAKGMLVRRAREELTIHIIIEEELLYPAAHSALPDDGKKDVDEAYVEHFLVKTLIEKSTTLKPGADGFDATFTVLTETVRHHVEEDESDLFPELRQSGLDLAALGERITNRKNELEAELPRMSAIAAETCGLSRACYGEFVTHLR
jgi:iron-sulfur cluster repair protein YtfE (RIC family)